MGTKEAFYSKITLEEIVDMIPANIYWLDRDGVYQGTNRTNLLTFGLDNYPEQPLGKTLFELIGDKFPDVAKTVWETDMAIMESGEHCILEEEGHNPVGTRSTYLTSKKVLRDKSGEVIGLLGASIDISDRKALEEALKREKKKAEKASQAKTEFITNLSHDLRLPLTNVLGMAQHLKDHELNRRKQESLQHILDAGQSLLNLFDDILKRVNLDYGELALREVDFELNAILDEVLNLVRPEAEKKGLALLRIGLQSSALLHLRGDAMRLRRILLNLLGNAIKFTEKGSITIGVKEMSISMGCSLFQFTVEDTGIGIPQDKQEFIFERFSQVTPHNSEQYEGVGLGLSVVKNYIADMSGSIDVKSTEGQGTCFTFTVPFYVGRRDTNLSLPPVKPQHTKKDTLNILLVEDNPMAQEVARLTLKEVYNCTIDHAGTLQEALGYLHKAYHLIILDLGLPDGTGEMLADIIREKPHLSNAIVIVLTAHIDPLGKAQLEKLGVRVESKPLTRDICENLPFFVKKIRI